MKTTAIAIAAFVLLFSCKKREELPSNDVPSTQQVRIAEITDSTDNAFVMNQRLYYDAQNRISRLERTFSNIPPITYNYQYENGLLSSITWMQEGSPYGVYIERNNQLCIIKIQVVNGLMGGNTFTFGYDDAHNLIYSTSNAHTDIAPFPEPDTTTYSNFVNGRYTLSYHQANDTLNTRTRRNFNDQGLLQTSFSVHYLKRGLQYVASDSIRLELNYFPLSELERSMINQHEELIKKYYSPNRDVYDKVLASYFPFWFPPMLSLRGYNNDILISQQDAAIEKKNTLNLPSHILITDPGETRDYPYVPGPAKQTRRTIRYETE